MSRLFFSPVGSSSEDRILRGVMRIGLVANGLLLKGDEDLDLVLLCSSWPTGTLLKQVAEKLTKQLEVEMNVCFFLVA